MTHSLPTTTTHNTPINKIKTPKSQIIPCKNLFFFLISKKIILKKPHENIRQNREYREGNKKKRKKKRRKQEHKRNQQKLITKKRTKEHRDRITRGESPSPRPIKKSATKVSE